jgi:hypothetical protein
MSRQTQTREMDDRIASASRDSARAPRAKRDRLLGGALSLAVHLSILVLLTLAWTDTSKVFVPSPPKDPDTPVTVSLVQEPRPAPAPPAPAPTPKPTPKPTKRAPVKPPPRLKVRMARREPPPEVERLPAGEATAAGESAELSGAQLAGASSADSGPVGRPCDMARRVQSALRKDPLVQAAVLQAHGAGKALMVWNGDWVKNHGEDGKGLSAVREAILWEVAFAPPECRTEPMRGLIVLSLNTASGSARLAVGQDQWRWQDLLKLR